MDEPNLQLGNTVSCPLCTSGKQLWDTLPCLVSSTQFPLLQYKAHTCPNLLSVWHDSGQAMTYISSGNGHLLLLLLRLNMMTTSRVGLSNVLLQW